MGYSPAINDLYTCELILASELSEDKTYDVVSDDSTEESIEHKLNYINPNIETLPLSVNKLQFRDGNKKTINSGFKNYNFLNNKGTSTIPIEYEFIVGYKIDITDIKPTLIQATTVCALYHKDASGNYNYRDFGIYEQDGEYLSDVMFYNSGTSEQEIFGLCKQIATQSTKTMLEQCQSITSPYISAAQEIRTPGKLNSGTPLQQMIPYIGKLTFCQPHVHGLSETYGVNIHEGPYSDQYGIPPKAGHWPTYGSDDDRETGYGIVPRMYLFNHPKYNLSLNTKNAILYNSEFISTLHYETFVGYAFGVNTSNDDETHWVGNLAMRRYTGFTGEQLATFNRKLLKTMETVYAYNPDYDSLAINVGNVQIQNKNIKFTSNLVNQKSNLNFSNSTSLNDYIYLGPIKFSDYLEGLNMYSENYLGVKIPITTIKDGKSVINDQLQFIPDFTYCGTEEGKYLVSSITYNTPTPYEIEDELSFKTPTTLFVKHSDGTQELLSGSINKRALYGFNSKLKKLVQLDVSNYTISSDGTLKLNSSDDASEKQTTSINFNKDTLTHAIESYYNFNYDFIGSDGVTTTVEVSTTINTNSSNMCVIACGENSIILAVQREGGELAKGFTFNYDASLNSKGTSMYTHYAQVGDARVYCIGRVLDYSEVALDTGSGHKLPLTIQSYESLHSLLYNGFGTFVTNSGENRSYTIESLEVAGDHRTYINGNVVHKNESVLVYDMSNFSVEVEMENLTEAKHIELYELTIDNMNIDIIRNAKLSEYQEAVIATSPTLNYSSNNMGSPYKVDNTFNDSRLRGTSITINDLTYEPNTEGHRLFMKNNLCKYDSAYRGKLYYRDWNNGNVHESWICADTEHLNCLFLYTGPCFTTDNLN
jgi:hypothetical protein